MSEKPSTSTLTLNASQDDVIEIVAAHYNVPAANIRAIVWPEGDGTKPSFELAVALPLDRISTTKPKRGGAA